MMKWDQQQGYVKSAAGSKYILGFFYPLVKCSRPELDCFDNGADSPRSPVFKHLELFLVKFKKISTSAR